MLGGPEAAEVVGRCDSSADALAAAHTAGATLLVMAQPAHPAPLAGLFAPMAVLGLPAAGDAAAEPGDIGQVVMLGGRAIRLDRARLMALAGQLQAGVVA